MISVDPANRPNIDQVKEYLAQHHINFSDERKITAEELGISDDLVILETSFLKDVKKRAEKFEHCPFSAVNFMNSFDHLTPYEELSNAG